MSGNNMKKDGEEGDEFSMFDELFMSKNRKKLMQIKRARDRNAKDEVDRKFRKKKERQILFDVQMPKLETWNSDEAFLADNDYLKNYLAGNYEYFFLNSNGKNFQKQYHNMNQRVLYKFENNLMTGDYLMLWPNPDLLRRSIARDENQINYKTAQKTFNDIFNDVTINFNGKKKFQKKLAEAFEYAFFGLRDWSNKRKKVTSHPRDELAGYSCKLTTFLEKYPEIMEEFLTAIEEKKMLTKWRILERKKLREADSNGKIQNKVLSDVTPEYQKDPHQPEIQKDDEEEDDALIASGGDSKTDNKACCGPFGKKKKVIVKQGNLKALSTKNHQAAVNDTADLQEELKNDNDEEDSKKKELENSEKFSQQKLLANGQFYIPENLVRYPYAADAIPYFYEDLDTVDYIDDMNFHKLKSSNGKELKKDKFLGKKITEDDDVNETEDFLRNKRVRYRLEVIQESGMDYDIELWYIYKKLNYIDNEPNDIKKGIDQLNTLGSCCKQLFDTRGGNGQKGCGCGQKYVNNCQKSKEYEKRMVNEFEWLNEESPKITDPKVIERYSRLECNCETHEQILDTFTDKYKIRKVCFHGEFIDGKPKFQNWYTQHLIENDAKKTQYSVMFDRRTVFLVLSPSDKNRFQMCNKDLIKFANNPCLTREIQILYKAPAWVKDGSRVVLKVKADNKGSVLTDSDNVNECCQGCSCCNCCCRKFFEKSDKNKILGSRVYHDLQVAYYQFEPLDWDDDGGDGISVVEQKKQDSKLKKDLLKKNPQDGKEPEKQEIENDIKMYRKLKDPRYIKETVSNTRLNRYEFTGVVINPTNMTKQYIKYEKRQEYESKKLSLIFKCIDKHDNKSEIQKLTRYVGDLGQNQKSIKMAEISHEDKDSITFNFKKIEYIRENARTHDFVTLLRKVFNTVAAMSGLVVRQFVTLNLYHIASVIYCPEENLKAVAQTLGLNKQMEVGKTDIFSIEPVDKDGRTYRLNPLLYDEVLWNKKYHAPALQFKEKDCEMKTWRNSAVPILKLLGTYDSNWDDINEEEIIVPEEEENSEEEDEMKPFYDINKEFENCVECNKIKANIDDEVEKQNVKYLKQHRRLCSPRIMKNKKKYYWGLNVYIRHTRQKESNNNRTLSAQAYQTILQEMDDKDKTHLNHIKDDPKFYMAPKSIGEEDEEIELQSLGCDLYKDKKVKKIGLETAREYNFEKELKAEQTSKQKNLKKLRTFLKSGIQVRVTALGHEQKCKAELKNAATLQDINQKDNALQNDCETNLCKKAEDKTQKHKFENQFCQTINFYEKGFELNDDFQTFYNLAREDTKKLDQEGLASKFLHDDRFEIEILRDKTMSNGRKETDDANKYEHYPWENENKSKVTEKFHKFTGMPDKDLKISLQEYWTDLNEENRKAEKESKSPETEKNKDVWHWYLCVEIHKVEYKKFNLFTRNTGAPLSKFDTKQNYDEYDGDALPNFWEWSAYEMYLRNLIPKMIQIDKRYISEKTKILSMCEEVKYLDNLNQEALLIGKYNKDVDDKIVDINRSGINGTNFIPNTSQLVDSSMNSELNASTLRQSAEVINNGKKKQQKSKKVRIQEAKEYLKRKEFGCKDEDLNKVFITPRAFKCQSSNNRRIRTKNTKERQKVDIAKLKYHTANLYKKSFQLALIDTNYEINDLDALGLVSNTKMTAYDKFLDIITFGSHKKKNFAVPKVESLWGKLNQRRPMNFSMQYFRPARTRKPLVKDYYKNIWKSYEVNEYGDRALFSQMERQKCIFWLTQQLISFKSLQRVYYENDNRKNMFFDKKCPGMYEQTKDIFFPLHDDFKVHGIAMNKLFEDVINMKKARGFEIVKTTMKGKFVEAVDKKEDYISEDEDDKENVLPKSSTNREDLINSSDYPSKDSSPNKQDSIMIVSNRAKDSLLETNLQGDQNYGSTNNYANSVIMDQGKQNKDITELNAEKDSRSYEFMKKYINMYIKRKNVKKEIEIYSTEVEKKIDIKLTSKLSHVGSEQEQNKYVDKNEKKFNLTHIDLKDYPLSDKFSFWNLLNENFRYEVIRDYYGEKVTIYFKFLIFYCNNSMWLMLLGIITFLIGIVKRNVKDEVISGGVTTRNSLPGFEAINYILTIIFSVSATLWLSSFLNKWRNEEVKFAIMYNKGDADDVKYERNEIRSYKPAYPFERDLVTDNQNSKPYFSFLTHVWCFLAILFLLFCYAAQIGMTIGLLYLKNEQSGGDDGVSMLHGWQNLVNGIEIIKVITFNHMFTKLALEMTKNQQYKFIEDFQVSYINIVIFSQLFSIVQPMFFIIFVKKHLPNLSCNGYCEDEASLYIAMYFYFKLAIYFQSYIKRWCQRKYTIKKGKRIREKMMKLSSIKNISSDEADRINELIDKVKMQEEVKTKKKVGSLNTNIDQSKLKSSELAFTDKDKNLLRKFQTILDECKNPRALHGLDNKIEAKVYALINREIERQIQLQTSEMSEYRIHIVNEYLEVFQLLLVSCVAAPIYAIGFVFTWVIVAIEFENDKEKYLFTMRKLDPQSGGTIGHLNQVLYFMSWLCVATNSILMVKHLSDTVSGENYRMFLFFGSFIGLIIIKYIIVDVLLYGQLPEDQENMKERREYVIKKVMTRYPDKLADVSNKKEENFFYRLENRTEGLPGGDKPKPKKMKN